MIARAFKHGNISTHRGVRGCLPCTCRRIVISSPLLSKEAFHETWIGVGPIDFWPVVCPLLSWVFKARPRGKVRLAVPGGPQPVERPDRAGVGRRRLCKPLKSGTTSS